VPSRLRRRAAISFRLRQRTPHNAHSSNSNSQQQIFESYVIGCNQTRRRAANTNPRKILASHQTTRFLTAPPLMAPSKAARSGQDDSKNDAATSKEKNGSGGGSKMRRVASSAGSNLREVTNASATTNAAAATASDSTPNTQEASTPGVGSSSGHCTRFRSSTRHLLTSLLRTAAMARL
jgi:hypothetical protein